MERFNEAYVNHRNRYTGLRYKDDPAIVADAPHQRERRNASFRQYFAA